MLHETTRLLGELPAEVRPSLVDMVKKCVQVRQKLPTGWSIADIVTGYLKLLDLLPEGVSPATAVEDYMERRSQIDHDIAVPDAIDRFVTTREKLDRSQDHIRDIEARLTRFGEAHPIPVSKVTAAMVQRYMDGHSVSLHRKLKTDGILSILKIGFFVQSKSQICIDNYLGLPPNGPITHSQPYMKAMLCRT